MSQAFTPIARSRASYYCKGSPVHFSMVELFRMEETGETVVTLTFKTCIPARCRGWWPISAARINRAA